MTATIHLIHGFIGFGKTKTSKELAHELPAIILNNDDFMARLYGKIRHRNCSVIIIIELMV